MALQLQTKRSFVSWKLVGASLAVLAFFLQPLVALNISEVFATSGATGVVTVTVAPAPSASNGESVRLAYDGTGTLDLAGWKLSDTVSSRTVRYTFTSGQTLTNGQSLLMCGDMSKVPGCTVEYSGGNSVWNNTGDSAILTDAGGVDVITVAWTSTVPTDSQRSNAAEVDYAPPTIDNAVCATGCEYTNLADAVAGESSGSTITVKSGTTLEITSQIIVNKSLTITGESGATITTSGSSHVLVTTAPNVTISHLNFVKTDHADQNLINIQGANTTISDNTFSGQFSIGGGEVSRALEVSTTTGLNISSNTFNNLRQPAYINDNTSGSVTGNYVNQTKGIVAVANTHLTFSGNTWGTNVVDIAFIPGTPNNYDCDTLATIKADNANATIDNQALVRHCVTPPAEQSITVRPSAASGWAGVDDNGNGNGGSLDYVAGPSTPPLGSGSAQLAVTGTNQGYLLAKAAYGGTKLADIATLDYQTYSNTTNNLLAPTLQLNVTPDVTTNTAYNGRLVYEPYMNGTVQNGTWQTWNAAAGKWWLSKPQNFGNSCAQSSPCTFEQLISLYPNIGIVSGANQMIGFKAGSSWTNYTGSVDAFHIATATANDDYNFEQDVPADTSKPTVELVSPDNGSYNPGEYKVSASDNQELAVVTGNLYDSNGLNKSCSKTVSGVTDYILTCAVAANLPNGTYTIRYNAKDAAGLISATKTSTFIIDHTNPTVTLKDTSVGNISQRVLKEADFKLHDNSKVRAYIINGTRVEVTPNAYSDANDIKVGSRHGVYGENTIQVEDMAGNLSDPFVFTLDNIGPKITPTSYTGDTDAKIYSKVSFSFYDQYKIVRYELNGHSVPLSPNAYSNANFNDMKQYYGLHEGTNTIVVYDMAGNATSYTFELDLTAPDASFTFNPSNDVVKKGPVTVTMHATEPIRQPAGWDKTDDSTYTKTESANGKYYVTITDIAGNSKQVMYEVKRIDTTNPVIGGVSDGDLRNSNLSSFTVTDQNFDQYPGGVTVDGSNVTCTEPVSGWVWTCPGVSGDGPHTIVATDKAGNKTTVSFTIDTTAPVLSNLSYIQNDDNAFKLSVVTNDAAPVTFTLDNNALSGAVGTDNGDGTWTWQVITSTLLAGSHHDFLASSVDAAGNLSAAPSKSFNVALPRTTPIDNNTTPIDPIAEAARPVSAPQNSLVTTNANDTNATTNNQSDDEGDILGAKNNTSPSDRVAAVAPSAQGWKFWGVAWYWWLLAVAALAAFWWFIAAWRRRRKEDEAGA